MHALNNIEYIIIHTLIPTHRRLALPTVLVKYLFRDTLSLFLLSLIFLYLFIVLSSHLPFIHVLSLSSLEKDGSSIQFETTARKGQSVIRTHDNSRYTQHYIGIVKLGSVYIYYTKVYDLIKNNAISETTLFSLSLDI